jgi:hypothetical protein
MGSQMGSSAAASASSAAAVAANDLSAFTASTIEKFSIPTW